MSRERTVIDGGPIGRPYSAELVDRVSDRLISIAQVTRIQLLDLLEVRGESYVQELVDELETTQQNVSRHLRVLLADGLVTRRQEGRRAWYRLTDPQLIEPVHAAIRLLDDFDHPSRRRPHTRDDLA